MLLILKRREIEILSSLKHSVIECIFLLNSIRKSKWEQIVLGRSIITWEFQCNEPFEELHETVSTDELCAHIFECLCWVWNNMIYTIIIYSVLVSSLQAHQAHRLFHIVVRQNTEVHSFHVGFTGYFFFSYSLYGVGTCLT